MGRQIRGIIRHRLIMAAVQRFDYYLSNSSFAPLPVADRSIKATALIKATSAELIIPSWLWPWLSARVTKHLRFRGETRGKFSLLRFEIVAPRFDEFHYLSGLRGNRILNFINLHANLSEGEAGTIARVD